MSCKTTPPDKYDSILVLQALSTFFVNDAPPSPGFNYTPVPIRLVARFLNRDESYVRGPLGGLAQQGFCEITPFEARLTPSRWSANLSRWSAHLAYYVFHAPACLKGPDSLIPVNPAVCFNAQPKILQGKSTTIASSFNGVYSGSQWRELCEQPPTLGPYELAAIYHCTADCTLPASCNLNFLRSSCNGATFRGFLSSIWLQTITQNTPFGPVGGTLADYIDHHNCLVLAPSDALGLEFQTVNPTASPFGFVAALVDGVQYPFEDPSSYPFSLQLLNGQTLTLRANGIASIDDAIYLYQLLGPAAGQAYLIALVAIPPLDVNPDAAPVYSLPRAAPCCAVVPTLPMAR